MTTAASIAPSTGRLLDRLACHQPDPVARLPLALLHYPHALRDDILAAIAETLDVEPAPAPADTAAAGGDRPLPPCAPRLIVVQGDPRAGKDVVAAHLRATYQAVGSVMTSTAIRAEVNDYLAPYGHRVVEANKSLPHYRHLLQAWGMSRQEEDPDYWPNAAIPQVQAAWAKGMRLVVITGLRWPHDAQCYRAVGGQIWRVERPGNPYQTGHYAEDGFKDTPRTFFDRVVVNAVEGDLAPFHAAIEAALMPA